jgi:SsrA-binding protein
MDYRLNNTLVCDNKKARFEYFVEEELEAGIQLLGSEVKSIRTGRVSIGESHIVPEVNNKNKLELWLVGATISEYKNAASYQKHEPTRKRRLLLSRTQINKWAGQVQRKGKTIVPLKLYFNAKGNIKLQIALVTGKTKGDKRETSKEREWNRDKQRILKGESGVY